MSRVLLLTSLLAHIILGNNAWSQTRSLSGSIILDAGPSEVDRAIVVIVRNHSFTVLPPSFSILRPVTSTESTLVFLPQGSSSVDYSIDGIISDPSDHSISIQCLGCSNNFPTQYYTPTNNRFTLGGSAYIDPSDLPSTLNITAITRTSISGEISLGRVAERDLNFSIDIFSVNNPELSYKTLSSIILPTGMSGIAYSVTGLNRSIGLDQYGVRLQCNNCFGSSRRPQIFDRQLPANQHYSLINFLASDEKAPPITPILDLLLQ